MIYLRETSTDMLEYHQQKLIRQGYKILDIVIVYNSYLNGQKFFIKYVKE